MPTTLGSAAFITLLTLRGRARESQLKKYFGNGGVNFWYWLHKYAPLLAAGRITFEEIKADLAVYKPRSMKESNLRTLGYLERWLKRKAGIGIPTPAIFIAPIVEDSLYVRVQPALGLQIADRRELAFVWGTKKPRLFHSSAEMGLLFMKRVLLNHGIEDYRLLLVDSIEAHDFQEGRSDTLEERLAAEISDIADTWNRLVATMPPKPPPRRSKRTTTSRRPSP